jgi:hypothetical protein
MKFAKKLITPFPLYIFTTLQHHPSSRGAWTFFYTILLRHFFCSISASLILQMPHKDRPHGQFCTVRVLFISFSDFPSIDLSA